MITVTSPLVKTHFLIAKSKIVFTCCEHPDKTDRRVKSGGRFVGETKPSFPSSRIGWK